MRERRVNGEMLMDIGLYGGKNQGRIYGDGGDVTNDPPSDHPFLKV